MTHAGRTLAPAAQAAGRLGLLGGSFDPPHLGHLHLAESARMARALDHVVWVPAARPPHKLERRLAPAEERVRMLELLLTGERDASIWTVELEREGPSYTVDTLRALQAERHVGEIFLLLGSDNLAQLPSWHQVDQVLTLAHPVVVPRRGAPVDPPGLGELPPELAERLRAGTLTSAVVDVSSTELRGHLADPLAPPRPELDRLLPAGLREYIAERGIYRAT